jgi:hypothetical protein
MNATRGAGLFSWSPSLSLYFAQVLRLLLVVAGLFGALRLGNWIRIGGATLIGQSTVRDNSFTTRSLGAPSNLIASAAGGDVQLSWTAGQNGTGYALARAANGNSSDCSAAAFSSLAAPDAANYVDAGADAPPGGWNCYQVATAAGEWTSPGPNPTAAVQLGFVASSVAFINAGDTSTCGAEQTSVAGELDCGDQVVIGFNQPVIASTGPASAGTLCADSSGDTLLLGSAITTGACSPAETVSVGTLSGSSVDGCDCRFNASYTWDAVGQTLAVTIGARTAGAGYPSLGGSLWTFKPTTDTTRLHSTTGDFHVCDYNTGAANCWPGTH